MAVKTIEELKAHLEKYKDTLVVIGPGIHGAWKLIQEGGYKDKLTNKNLIRHPDEFWDTFKTNVYVNPDTEMTEAMKNLLYLCQMGYVKNILDLNTDGLFTASSGVNVIRLHGNSQYFYCQKCKTIYTSHYVFGTDEVSTTCEQCGKGLKPDILLSGESYDQEDYDKLIDELNLTHTVMVLGFNYDEQPIVDLLGQYAQLKESQRDQGEDKLLIAITNPELEYDLNSEIGFHEFLVKEDCDTALPRLVKSLE